MKKTFHPWTVYYFTKGQDWPSLRFITVVIPLFGPTPITDHSWTTVIELKGKKSNNKLFPTVICNAWIQHVEDSPSNRKGTTIPNSAIPIYGSE